MNKKEYIAEKINFIIGDYNGKIEELESNDDYIVINSVSDYGKSKEDIMDAWDDFKGICGKLRKAGVWIEYGDNETPEWDAAGEWSITINVKKSYLR